MLCAVLELIYLVILLSKGGSPHPNIPTINLGPPGLSASPLLSKVATKIKHIQNGYMQTAKGLNKWILDILCLAIAGVQWEEWVPQPRIGRVMSDMI